MSPAVSSVITHPPVVDLEIFSWQEAFDIAIERFDLDVTATSAAATNGVPSVHVPDSGFELEVLGDQRTHGADVHRVAGHGVVDGDPRKHIDHCAVSTFHHTQFAGTADLITEPYAPCTNDAAIAPDRDGRSQFFGMADVLVLDEATAVRSVGVGVILQDAFAGLVANRAIERMVDQLEFHDGVPRFDGHVAVSFDFQPVRDSFGTGDDRLGRAIALDHADAAIAGDGETRVVTEIGDIHTMFPGRFHDGHASWIFYFLTVEEPARHRCVASSHEMLLLPP